MPKTRVNENVLSDTQSCEANLTETLPETQHFVFELF